MNFIYTITWKNRCIVIHRIPLERSYFGKVYIERTINGSIAPSLIKSKIQPRGNGRQHAELYKEQHIHSYGTVEKDFSNIEFRKIISSSLYKILYPTCLH